MSKYSPKLSLKDKEEILTLCQTKTATEISKIYHVSPTAIRTLANKKDISIYKPEVKKYERSCVVCLTLFTPKYKDHTFHSTTCSPKCSSENKSKKRHFKNVSEEQMEQVKSLKIQGVVNKEISKKTGLTLHTIKKIFKINNIKSTKENISKNLSISRKKMDSDAFSEKMSKTTIERNKPLLDKVLKKISKKNHVTLLSERVGKKHSLIKLRCSFHGDFKRKLRLVLKGNFCQKCNIEKRAKKQTYSYEYVKNYIESVSDHKLVSTTYINSTTPIIFSCKNHGLFKMLFNSFQQGQRCPRCYNNSSKGEEEITNYIESLGFKVETSNRSLIHPYEVDIYVPEKSLAIEFNGLYYHSEDRISTFKSKDGSFKNIGKKRDYHYNKFKKLEDLNVSFLSIFEDSWYEKKELIKKMIAYRLGVSDVKLRASKLEVRKIKNKEFEPFFEKNHLDGNVRSAYVGYGLYHKNELVSCISLRNANREGLTEIARFCNKAGYNIYRSFSTLMKEIIKDKDNGIRNGKIITYSNNCLGTGQLYKKSGFEEVPLKDSIGYCYTDFKKRKHRASFQRKTDPEILEKYPTEEAQALAGILSKPFGHNRPIYKIWDCGKKRWELKII